MDDGQCSRGRLSKNENWSHCEVIHVVQSLDRSKGHAFPAYWAGKKIIVCDNWQSKHSEELGLFECIRKTDKENKSIHTPVLGTQAFFCFSNGQ